MANKRTTTSNKGLQSRAQSLIEAAGEMIAALSRFQIGGIVTPQLRTLIDRVAGEGEGFNNVTHSQRSRAS
jgi:hypothetical protein